MFEGPTLPTTALLTAVSNAQLAAVGSVGAVSSPVQRVGTFPASGTASMSDATPVPPGQPPATQGDTTCGPAEADLPE